MKRLETPRWCNRVIKECISFDKIMNLFMVFCIYYALLESSSREQKHILQNVMNLYKALMRDEFLDCHSLLSVWRFGEDCWQQNQVKLFTRKCCHNRGLSRDLWSLFQSLILFIDMQCSVTEQSSLAGCVSAEWIMLVCLYLISARLGVW